MKKCMVSGMLVLVLLLGGCGNDATAGYDNISSAEAKKVLADPSAVVVLDIRTPAEFIGGHIRGAVNIDFYANDFKSKLEALDKDATYLIYCRTGNRTGQSLSLMQQLGFKRILHLENGITEWVGQGLPVVR